jgi:hypothetical protein
VKDRLAVSKRGAQKTDTGRSNLKKLNKRDVQEQCQVTIRNKFTALKNLEENGGISREWNNIRGNIKFLAQESLDHCDSKNHEPWFDEECSKLAERRKQAKL